MSRPKAALLLISTALIAGTISAAAVLALDRPHAWGAGQWISDFVKSPGMAGLFAAVAALVAFTGIMRQIAQAKDSLKHERDADTSRAWWTRFEWAAERAVPADAKTDPLPWAAVVSTFDALAESATDAVQQRAVGAIVQIAAERSNSRQSPSNDESSEASDVTLAAMQAYLATTETTQAASSAVRAMVYDAQVVRALWRVFPDSVRTQESAFLAGNPQRRVQPDAVIDRDGRRVVVETKGYSKTPHPGRIAQIESQVRSYVDALAASGGLIVAPVDLPLPARAAEARVHSVKWTTADDDPALRRAVEGLLGS